VKNPAEVALGSEKMVESVISFNDG